MKKGGKAFLKNDNGRWHSDWAFICWYLKNFSNTGMYVDKQTMRTLLIASANEIDNKVAGGNLTAHYLEEASQRIAASQKCHIISSAAYGLKDRIFDIGQNGGNFGEYLITSDIYYEAATLNVLAGDLRTLANKSAHTEISEITSRSFQISDDILVSKTLVVDSFEKNFKSLEQQCDDYLTASRGPFLPTIQI